MPSVTLLAKIYNKSQLHHIEDNLKSAFEGLRTQMRIQGTTPRGWVQVAVSGEDEKVAVNYLASEIGLCPTRLDSVEKFLTSKGRISTSDSSGNEVLVDIGVFSPTIVDASIPLSCLQAQLADGRKIALGKLIQLFGLCKDLPITIKTLKTDEKENHIEAMLAEEQINRYKNWTRSLLDRLIVLGATIDDVESAIKRAECGRDIVGVEPLGVFEYAIVCKLGTDAIGLVPRIGKKLQAAFSIFSPRRILAFFKDDCHFLASY